MLWTLIIILLLLWSVGMISSFTAGGFLHIFLALALAALVIQLITRRRTV